MLIEFLEKLFNSNKLIRVGFTRLRSISFSFVFVVSFYSSLIGVNFGISLVEF